MTHQSTFSDYVNRWLFSTNAKDIAVLYFIFSLFCGILGTIMSLVLRLELSAPGNQILLGNHQLFNVIATAHAILMGARRNLVKRWSHIYGCSRLIVGTTLLLAMWVKRIKAWRVELVGVTQSAKLNLKGVLKEYSPQLDHSMVTLRNLILIDCHAWDTNQIGLDQNLYFNTISEIYANNFEIISERKSNKNISKNLRNDTHRIYGTVWSSNSILEYGKPRNIIMSNHYNVWGLRISKRSYVTDVKPINRVTSVTPNIISIADVNNLVKAYESIKSKPGNMTKGSDNKTLDGINIKWINKTSELLKTGKFKFSPGRVKFIPKPGNTEMRKLILTNPRDKVVQKAIELIFTDFYDKQFNNASHGFRPNKGVQTAIKMVDSNFQSSRFVIEGDLRKAFDSISHEKLMNKLKSSIKCVKTLKLVENMLKAGYIENGILIKSNIGVPQGNILSPLLCNLFLDDLDNFMDDIKEKYSNKIGSGVKNPEYNKLFNKARRLRNKGDINVEYKSIMKKLLNTPSKSLKKVNITYVRYADDFIIGVEGSKQLAILIKDEIKVFLDKLELTLNLEKTKITDFYNDYIVFLGYKIKSMEMNDKAHEVINDKRIGRKITRRKKVRLSFEFDYQKVLNKLKEANIVRLRVRKQSNNKMDLIHIGRFRGNLINLDHADILIYYNAIARGIYNYYCICRNHNQLFNVLWLIKESCALTLARKFKLRTMRKVFALFGKNLTYKKKVMIKGIERWRVYNFFAPEDTTRVNIGKWAPNIHNSIDSIISKSWGNKLTKSNLFSNCAICGSQEDVEMHHVRSIKDLRDPKATNKDWFTRSMNSINRKQIPLCRLHHEQLHHNKIKGFDLTLFNNYIRKQKSIHIEEFTKYSKRKLTIVEDVKNPSKADNIDIRRAVKTNYPSIKGDETKN